jgi:hypothetical protein
MIFLRMLLSVLVLDVLWRGLVLSPRACGQGPVVAHLPSLNLAGGLVFGHSSQDGDSQQQETGPLLIPQLNRLNEAFLVRGEDASNMPTIPTQKRITTQILKHWRPFEVLQEALAVSRRAEHSSGLARSNASSPLRRTLCCVLSWASCNRRKRIPPSVSYGANPWLGVIRPHRRDDAWSGLADLLCPHCGCADPR